MKTFTVAVIGCGTISRGEHIPAYQKSGIAQIKYVVDEILERAEATAKEFGIPHFTNDLQIVLNDPEVEAISVCTPNTSHAPISIAAMKAGKHVLCEKPAGMNYDEVEEMKRVADETGKILNIGVVNRYNTAVNKIKQLVDTGELGNVYHVYCSFRSHRSIPGLGGPFTIKEKSGGGVLIDWGVHFLDLIFYILGEHTKARTVSGATYGEIGAQMENYTYTDMWAGPPKLDGQFNVDDFVTGLIRTTGPTISLNGAWAQNIGEKAMYIEILGSKAGVKLEYMGDFKLYSTKNGMLFETQASFAKEHMYHEEIKGFLNSVAELKKDRANIDNILTTAKVLDAIYESSAKNREILV